MTCPANAWTANAPNPHVLQGALVDGPQMPNDLYTDRRGSADAYVSLAQNAGFTGAHALCQPPCSTCQAQLLPACGSQAAARPPRA